MTREPMARGDLLLLAAILSAAGAAVAAYLTYEWYSSFGSAVCDFSGYFSCSAVGRSPYAAIGGVPTSFAGLAGFLFLLAFAASGLAGRERFGPFDVDLWLLVFAAIGAILGFVLSLVEVIVIQAVCVLCAAGFGLDLGVLAAAVTLRGRA